MSDRVWTSKGVVIPAVLSLACASAGLLAWAGASAGAQVSEASVTTLEAPSIATDAPAQPLVTPYLAATSLDSGVGTSGSGVARAWVSDMAARTGIGDVALAAYAGAALRIGTEQPTCTLGWTTLAAIGWVESQHGTIDGNALLPDGTTRTPILGPALDGGDGVGAHRAQSEDTAAHGNAEWDQAVGPMQFIGSTWRRWGADGDDDGRTDRTDIDDAAYAAARYLCADGHDLATGPGWTAAVRSYNHSDAYVASVLATADDYGARVG
ncbi:MULTISPECIES: lytic murein transglycosylase [Mumia]|uniref:lytic murein transglycosylase n=1 Tax=Mumia TaxID=1546255 RepID=UPI00141DB08D|nr:MULTISPECIES: lytic murein transglycosylase [unclassified Mumia]QMW66010.1 lytic murein transglycosylase [Mumia sp. ZJ1417]